MLRTIIYVRKYRILKNYILKCIEIMGPDNIQLTLSVFRKKIHNTVYVNKVISTFLSTHPSIYLPTNLPSYPIYLY